LTAGYKRWALLLTISLEILLAPFLLLFTVFAFKGVSEQVETDDIFSWLLLSSIVLFLLTYTIADLYLTWKELRRSDFAIKINRSGIHVWRSTINPIPWSDVVGIEVNNMFLDSGRSIEISLKKEIVAYPSPYSLVNVHRYLAFGRVRRNLTINLTGVACDNRALRSRIGDYTNKLDR